MSDQKRTATFTKLPDALMASKSLILSEKVLISHVLRWQIDGKRCFESTDSISKRFNISASTIGRAITNLNKTNFFKSVPINKKNEHSKWSNRKQMVVYEEMLDAYLENEAEQLAANNNKPQEPAQLLQQPASTLVTLQTPQTASVNTEAIKPAVVAENINQTWNTSDLAVKSHPNVEYVSLSNQIKAKGWVPRPMVDKYFDSQYDKVVQEIQTSGLEFNSITFNQVMKNKIDQMEDLSESSKKQVKQFIFRYINEKLWD